MHAMRRSAVALVFGLLAVGIGFAVKRWREHRSYKADLDYERRRWGREQAMEVVFSSRIRGISLQRVRPGLSKWCERRLAMQRTPWRRGSSTWRWPGRGRPCMSTGPYR